MSFVDETQLLIARERRDPQVLQLNRAVAKVGGRLYTSHSPYKRILLYEASLSSEVARSHQSLYTFSATSCEGRITSILESSSQLK